MTMILYAYVFGLIPGIGATVRPSQYIHRFNIIDKKTTFLDDCTKCDAYCICLINGNLYFSTAMSVVTVKPTLQNKRGPIDFRTM